jgi:hypothetical protein
MKSVEEMKSVTFGEMLQIDPYKLDDELLRQPGLFLYWSEKASSARAKASIARFEQEKTEAQISNDVRKDPSKYGIEKVTEAGVTNAVRTSSEFEEVTMERIEATRKAEVLSAVVAALEQRKKSLENLCFLSGQGYFSQPSTVRREKGTRTK